MQTKLSLDDVVYSDSSIWCWCIGRYVYFKRTWMGSANYMAATAAQEQTMAGRLHTALILS